MTRRKWTEEEVQKLVELLERPGIKTMELFSEKLGRSQSSIYSKLTELRQKDNALPFIRNYTEDQEDYLNSFSNDPEDDSVNDAASFLGKSYDSIDSKLGRMRKNSRFTGYLKRRWTESEDNKIRFSRGKLTYKELSEILERTEGAVSQRARFLGIAGKNNDFSELGETIRKLAAEGYTRKEIAEKTNTDYTAIHNYIYRNGINCKKSDREKTAEQKREHSNFMKRATRRY